MGERDEGALFRPDFNRAVRGQASSSVVTGDAGALVLREVADRLGYSEAFARVLDHRAQHLVTHPLVELVMTRVLLLAQGWQDQDDADHLRHDPAARRVHAPRHVAPGGGRDAAHAGRARVAAHAVADAVDARERVEPAATRGRARRPRLRAEPRGARVPRRGHLRHRLLRDRGSREPGRVRLQRPRPHDVLPPARRVHRHRRHAGRPHSARQRAHRRRRAVLPDAAAPACSNARAERVAASRARRAPPRSNLGSPPIAPLARRNPNRVERSTSVTRSLAADRWAEGHTPDAQASSPVGALCHPERIRRGKRAGGVGWRGCWC